MNDQKSNGEKGVSSRKKVIVGIIGVGVIIMFVLLNGGGEGTSDVDVLDDDILDETELIDESNEMDGDDSQEVDVGDDVEGESSEDVEDSSIVLVEDMTDEELEEYLEKTGVEEVVKSSGGNGGISIGVTPYELGDTIKLGTLEVVVNYAQRVTDDNGNDAVLVDYDLKNTGSQSVNWSTAILSHVEQSEQELVRAEADENVDTKPRKTTKGIQEVFVINDESQIMLELTELGSEAYERALVIFDTPAE